LTDWSGKPLPSLGELGLVQQKGHPVWKYIVAHSWAQLVIRHDWGGPAINRGSH